LYLPIKYKDDGRDVVSGTDYVCIHVPISFMNAWATYFFLYSSFVSFSELCQYPVQGYSDVTHSFCPIASADSEVLPYQQYYYNMFLGPSEACFILILAEAVIYLAYYKDIIFTSVVFCNFMGMLVSNYY
jgi:hypothetical protein